MNGNYAPEAGLTAKDALASEDINSTAAQTYANMIAVCDGDQERTEIQAPIAAITSDEIKNLLKLHMEYP